MVSEKICKGFFYIISQWNLLIPGAGPVRTQRFLIGRIYVGEHQTFLHTIYISCGLHGFREDFLVFYIISLMETLNPRDRDSLDPRGLIGRIYVGDR